MAKFCALWVGRPSSGQQRHCPRFPACARLRRMPSFLEAGAGRVRTP